MSVDKSPDDRVSFEALLDGSRQIGEGWQIVFVAALSGTENASPTPSQAEAALQRRVDAIKAGRISGFIPFDVCGQPVSFS